MKKRTSALTFFMSIFICATGQTIIVNSDGTHSIGINHGSTSTIINPDGTHTIGINHGSTTTFVNPDGTHSIGINHGGTSTIVNPDGSHSIVIHNGSTSTIVNPDGSHSIRMNHNTNIHTDLSDNQTEFKQDVENKNYDTNAEYPSLRSLENNSFAMQSDSWTEELQKFRILKYRRIIDRFEFKAFKNMIKNNQFLIEENPANQIFNLNQQVELDQISMDNFLLKKEALLNQLQNKLNNF